MKGLLEWFEPRRSLYPWRRAADPYWVLVSEVMLQQTQASRVAPAFERFMAAFPTLADLAAATPGAVIRSWSGLGYNRRAVALWKTAVILEREHHGRVPPDPAALGRFPGIGPYTAAAVASIAFGRPVPAIDTNVRRVVARHALGREPEEVSTSAVERAAARLVSRGDPGAWNQAAMDVGRTVCRPAPRCGECPIRAGCSYRRLGHPPRTRPVRPTLAFQGSTREARGRVVRALTSATSVSLGSLASATGMSMERVAGAVAALVEEGMVRAGPAALLGRRTGRVRLP
ncbi:MAG TPA: A/G-specific adenine glycosylase [Actinomycetota bacterium]|nr:A/G-specific adenine glycosylase [Actinomycetota bacterium]